MSLRLRPLVAVAVVPAIAFVFLFIAQRAFDHGRILPVAMPLFALALGTVSTIGAGYAAERRQRFRVTRRNVELEEAVRERTVELRETQLEVIHRLAQATESRDQETGMHLERISRMCERLGLALGMTATEAETLRNASLLHDVGKIGVPDAILLQPGSLSPEDRELMRRHTTVGAELLSGSSSDVMRMAEEIARTHHERWDGGGYPAGLSGEQIPLVGRICAVCDVFDALLSDRPYKEPWPVPEALDQLRRERGKHFDPSGGRRLPGHRRRPRPRPDGGLARGQHPRQPIGQGLQQQLLARVEDQQRTGLVDLLDGAAQRMRAAPLGVGAQRVEAIDGVDDLGRAVGHRRHVAEPQAGELQRLVQRAGARAAGRALGRLAALALGALALARGEVVELLGQARLDVRLRLRRRAPWPGRGSSATGARRGRRAARRGRRPRRSRAAWGRRRRPAAPRALRRPGPGARTPAPCSGRCPAGGRRSRRRSARRSARAGSARRWWAGSRPGGRSGARGARSRRAPRAS